MPDAPVGRIEEMPWTDAAAAIAAGRPIVLPVGAAAKAHGPHLPLGTDRFVVEALAARLAERLPILIAPTATFGYYPAFVEYPGSQHLPADLFHDLLAGLIRGFVAAGAARIVILNNGVSTEAPIQIAAHTIYAESGVRPAIAHLFGRGADARLTDPTGGHADERETAEMLALRPDLVWLDRLAPICPRDPAPPLADAPRLARPVRLAHGRPPGPGEDSDLGATGDPRAATAETGAAILAATVDELTFALRSAFPDAPGFGAAGA